jgi:leucyl-tRNA synthetase
MILGENNEKMSKSRGNVVNPDDIVNEFGADTLRTYEMFIGAFDLSAAWSNEGVKGCRRFMDRVWKLKEMVTEEEAYSSNLETKMHQTIKKVTMDYESMKFNTAIAAMMSMVNEFYKVGSVTKGEFKTLIALLNPVAPHMTEELWQLLGEQGRVYQQKWPVYDEQKTIEDTIEIAVQINGKVKANLTIARDEKQEKVEEEALNLDVIKAATEGKTVAKVIYVPGRILNIVVK